MKDDQTKVACLNCKRKYYADNDDIPDDAEKGEAFYCKCAYGCGGGYAEMV